MATNDRRITFMRGDNTIICYLPLDAYEAGDIKETKERLAREMNCTPEEIEVRITGIEDGRTHKYSSLKIQLIDHAAVKRFSR
jgi:hypothetical protein